VKLDNLLDCVHYRVRPTIGKDIETLRHVNTFLNPSARLAEMSRAFALLHVTGIRV
jgi:hypothetical protein